MPRRDLYGILGVPTRAAPGEIKRAYRRIAFEFHPDVGKRPDPERFREAHEAYEILNDPNQRRSYDIKLGSRRQSLTAEPLRSRAPVIIIDDFLTLRPSIDELLDHIELNFFGYPRKSGGPSQEWRAIPPPRRGGGTGGGRSTLRLPCALQLARLRHVSELRRSGRVVGHLSSLLWPGNRRIEAANRP